MSTASPTWVGVESMSDGAMPPVPIAAPAPDATWHAAQLRAEQAGAIGERAAVGIDHRDIRSVTDLADVVDEGADLGVVESDRPTARLDVGVGERHAPRAEREVGRRPALVQQRRTTVRDACAVGAVTRRGVDEVQVGAVRGGLGRRCTGGCSDEHPRQEGAGDHDRHDDQPTKERGAHLTTQIVRNTKTQMASTMCQYSETPPAYGSTRTRSRARTRRTNNNSNAAEPGEHVRAVHAGQHPIRRSVRMVVDAEREVAILEQLIERERGPEADGDEHPSARRGELPAASARSAATSVNDDDTSTTVASSARTTWRSTPSGGHGSLAPRST